MLKDSLPAACRAFRGTHEPGAVDPSRDHRAGCEACSAWARRLAFVPQVRQEHALPRGLAERLRRIPQQEVVCRDVDRLMAATRAGVHGGPAELAACQHLDTCARCAAVFAAIAQAMKAARPRPMPQSLLDRLREVTKTSRVPRLLIDLDVRWAVAASIMMGLLLQPVAPTLASAFRAADARLGARAAQWIDDGSSGGRAALDRVGGIAADGLDHGAERLNRYGATWKDLYSRSRRTFAVKTGSPDETNPERGDRDGQ